MTVFVMLLPISQAARENILQFGGLILTGIVAFSSTTVIRDAAAGVTLRIVSPFTRGDYLTTDDLFGRVTEIGFFYTEIQTEDRSLVTIMNSNLLGTNFETIPSSGTLLETRVSIGYDVHHGDVETALKEAAETIGLEDPFVHVEELGNFAITYRVAGLLTEMENLLTVRSDFRKQVLDSMHSHDIEIVSPNFLNRRNLDGGKRFIPDKKQGTPAEQPAGVEEDSERTTEVIFEKALEAQEAEELNELLNKLENRLDEIQSSESETAAETVEKLQSRIETVQKRKDQIEEDLSKDQ
jgi:flagellar capping protein FliD